jgi:hypothetical protein
MQINLLPVQYRPKPAVRVWPVALTIALMLNLILTGSYWLTLTLNLTETNNDLHSVESTVANLQREVDEALWKEELQTAVKAKADYIRAQTEASILWHPALAALERAMIPGIYLTAVTFHSSGDINITGITDTVKTAAEFWGSLQAETGLEIVRMSTVTPGGNFNFILRGWYGREVPEDDEE